MAERGMVELVKARDLPRFREYLQMSVVGMQENFALVGDLQGPIPDPREFVESGPWEKGIGRAGGTK